MSSTKPTIKRTVSLLLLIFHIALVKSSTITVSTTPESCNNLNNGSVTITITSGTPDYNYYLYDRNPLAGGVIPIAESGLVSQDTWTFSNLSAGSYYVVGSESNGDYAGKPVTVSEPSDLLPGSIGNDQTICAGADPVLLNSIANASGGSGAIQYDWEYSEDAGGTWTSLGINTPTFDPPVSSTRLYRRKIWNNCPAVYSNAVTITVNTPPVSGGEIGIAGPDPVSTLCYNTSPAEFASSANATGGSPSGQYVWQYTTKMDAIAGDADWTDIPGSNSATLNYNTPLTVNTKFVRKYFNSCGAVYSDIIRVNVNPQIIGGTIAFANSALDTICKGLNPSDISSVTAASGGDGNFIYSWEYSDNGGATWTNTGATGLNYPTPNLNTTRQYRRKAFNAGCNATVYSNVLTVGVSNLSVSITLKKALTCYDGSDGELTANVTNGIAPYSYSWSNGQTTQTATSLNQNTYTVTVMDAGCKTEILTTQKASFPFKRPPQGDNVVPPLLTVSSSKTNSCEGSANGSIQVIGNGGIAAYTYAITNTSTLDSVSQANGTFINLDAGTYRTWIKDSRGCIKKTSSDLVISNNPAPTANAGADIAICEGNSYTFAPGSASATNYSSVTWTTSGTGTFTNVNTLTPDYVPSSADFTSGSVTLTLHALGTSNCPETVDQMILSFKKAVTLTGPSSSTLCAGGNVTFSVVAAGTGPFSYQWRKGGVNIPGATSSTYTLLNIAAGDAGNYDVVVTGACGSVTSNVAVLTVNSPVSLTTQPVSQALCPGNTATFSVAASGTGPFSYQWRKGGVNIPGATSSTYTIASVAAGDAGNYDAIVTGACGSVTSNVAVLTVNSPVSLTTQPVSQALCPGNTATFSVAASGTGPFSYQWRKGGVNIPGATSSTYTIASVVAGDAGNYDVVATGVCGGVTSNVAVLTVNTPVNITTQPVSQALCPGTTATFSVVAAGTGPFSYQWRKGGVNISGATSSTYTKLNIVAGDAGNYDVIVTGACGNVTSNVAVLTINTPVSITTQPGSQTLCPGNAATFSVAASGTGPFSYQWRKGGVNIPGATSSTYTIASVAAGHAGNYDVVVTGACGNVTSNVAVLTVNTPVSITTQPVSQALCPGTTATFTVVAAGTGPFTYQWRKGGVNIPGATSSTYTIASVAAGDAGNYDAIVTGACGNVTSNVAVLTVNTPVSITTQPVSQTLCPGNTVTFSVAASGTGPFLYQWRKGGVNIPGATSATYTILNIAAGDAGNYDVIVTGACGNVTSNVAVLTVNIPVSLTTQPGSQTLCPGNTVTFSVAAAGTGPLSYQWRKGGVNIPGATSSTYTIASVAAGDAGNYDVVVTGACGNVTSNVAVLTVNTPVSLTTQPVSQALCPSSTATFSVVAAGTGPFSYQWRKGGVNISGATSSTYTILNIVAGDAGNYDVIVTGACGNVISNVAVLTINTPVSITTQPVSQTLCPGNTASFSVAASGTGPFSYQWRKGGVNIPGATSSTYTIASVAAGHAGNYDVVVTGACGNVTSNVAVLTVNTPVSITTQPVSQALCPGTTATFSVAAAGTGPFSYQWRKGGVNIPGATSSTYTLLNIAAGDAGNYDAIVTGACGNVISNVAVLTVNTPVSITTQPVSQTLCPGNTVTFSVAASGTGPFLYQWRKGGVNIPGATSSTYTIASVAAGDAGNYDVIVPGACGNVTSNVAVLTVNTPVSITTQPVSQALCPGTTATFSVAAAGTGPFSYQWRKGGVNIPGATSSTYTIASVAAGDAGNYDVVVTGVCGNVTSNVAVLTVNTPVNITTQPVSQALCPGTTATFSVVAAGTGPFSYQWRKGGVNIPGATSSTYTILNIVAGDAGNYDVIVTGACGNVTSNVAVLTINTPVSLTTQPGSQTLCPGNAATFSVAASGTGPFSYQWRKGGVNIPGATSSTYTIASVAAGHAGNYDVVVTGACGNVTSNVAVLTVNTPVNITTQPVSQALCPGTTATFTVVASGTGPFSYQWRKGGVNIPGATSSTYTLLNIAAGDAGNYDVIVTGACGNVISNVAVLTVNTPVSITTQPVSQTLCPGNTATFSVASSGTGPFSYQWRKGGVNIPGATSSTYTILNIAASDAGNYDVIVTGACGNVTSNVAVLTVNTPVSLTTQPGSQTLCPGTTATFSVAAAGTGPFSYQWRKGGVNIPGATSSTYTIASVAAGDAGNYDVVVTGACGGVTSNVAVLTVNTPVSLTTQPVSQALCPGTTATFSVVAAGTGPFSYQWRKGGVDIAGATSATYTILNIAAGDAGNYDVVVTGACGNVTSNVAVLTVNTPVSITTQPVSQTVCPGNTATFSVAASGTGPFSYQWRKGGVDIPGATSSTYTLLNIAAGDAGNYDVVVTGVCRNMTSNVAVLTVNTPVNITTQPVSQALCPGTTVSFSVVAAGTGPLSYQWRKDGVDIPGATTSTFTIASVAAGDDGSYDVVVTGVCGNVTSNVAVLTVNTPVSITTQPVSQTLCSGNTATFSVVASGTGPFSYQWRRNGSDIEGATASSYAIASVTSADAGNYDVVVTGACGNVISSGAALSVNVPVSIITQPVAQTLCPGTTATFSVVAGGTGPFSYQWRKNGTDIVGENSSVYNIDAVANVDAGDYSVVVTGACGSLISEIAALQVNVPVTVSTQPESQNVCSHNSVTLNVIAEGTSPLLYQWRRNGVDIPGANGQTLSIDDVVNTDAGNYDVQVTNTCNTVISTVAVLVVHPETVPTITGNNTVCDGSIGEDYQTEAGMSGYAWTITGGTITSGQGMDKISVDWTSSGNHLITVTYVDGNGCTPLMPAELPVTVESLANVYSGPDTTVCNGTDYLNLKATAGSYSMLTWSTSGDGSFDDFNALNPLYTPGAKDNNSGNVILTLTAWNASGLCSTRDDFTLTIAKELKAAVGTSAPFTIRPETKISVEVTTNGHLYPTDLGLQLVSPDGTKVVRLVDPPFHPTTNSGDCNYNSFGDFNGVVFTNELTKEDSLDLCDPAKALPYTGTYGAVGDWNLLNGLNPAEGGWSVIVLDSMRTLTDLPDGYLVKAIIKFTDVSDITHTPTTIIFDSGNSINIPIVENGGTSYIVPLGLTTSCAESKDALAKVTVSGGVGPYTYLWDDDAASTSNQVTLGKGTYHVTVTDALGCSTTVTVKVTSPDPLKITGVSYSGAVDNALPCNSTKTDINIDVTGGTGTIRYTYDGANNILPVGTPFTGCGAGTYNFHIFDENGCQKDTTIVLTEPGAFVLNSIEITNISCHDAADGAIKVNVSGGTTPYNFTLSNGDANNSGEFGPLGPGTYTITVTDQNNCGDPLTASVLVKEPPVLSATVSATAITCHGANNGTITIQATGGTEPYRYSVDGGITYQDGSEFNGLIPGNYVVIVKDAHDCSTINTAVDITEPAAITIDDADLAITHVSGCYDDPTGAINVTAHGGTGALEYSINGTDFQLNGVFNNIQGGEYVITVRDANSCSLPRTVTVNRPEKLNMTVTSTNGTENSQGSIHVTATGGTAPYTYSLNGVGQASGDFTGLAPAVYQVAVTDAHGCREEQDVTIANLIISIDSKDALCYGESTGYIHVTLISGGNNVQYSIHGGNNPQDNGIFDNLPSELYHIKVWDESGASSEKDVAIGSGTQINASIVISDITSCAGTNSGVLIVQASGGTGSLTYSIRDNIFQANNTFNSLYAGDYTVKVMDEKGCSVTRQATIIQPDPITITVQTTNVRGKIMGTATVNATGGTGALQYSLDGTNYQSSANFSDLTAKDYTVYVRDANGCESSAGFTISLGASSVDIQVKQTCHGDNGSITVSYCEDCVPGTRFSIDNGITFQDNPVFANLKTGTYKLLIDFPSTTDYREDIFIGHPSVTPVIHKATCAQFTADGSIELSLNFAQSATYLWNTGQTNDSIYNLTSGTYIVNYITDQNCTMIDTFHVEGKDASFVIAGRDTSICPGKSIELSATPMNTSVGELVSYQWRRGDTIVIKQESSVIVIPDTASFYTVYMTHNNCVTKDSVKINLYPILGLSAGNDTIVGEGYPLQLNATNAGEESFLQYQWIPAKYLDSDTVKSPVLTAVAALQETIPYTVIGTTRDLCIEVDTVNVTIAGKIRPYSGLTPNNDGHNDFWVIDNIQAYPGVQVSVFNRWGERVFFSKKYDNETEVFNGTRNGKPLPEGTYYYIIESKDGSNRTSGPLTIMR